MKLNWKEKIGTKAILTTDKGMVYHVTLTEVIDSGDGLLWIHFIDKFGKLVVFTEREIFGWVEK